MSGSTTDYDAVIIGSGFGGSMVAQVLVEAGWRVLMLERGGWVRRGPENWAPHAVGTLTPYYSTETPYRALAGGERDIIGSFQCVGGPSVFFGGVSLRFRAEDFEAATEIADGSGAAWPYRYADLEPHYAQAERLLGVAGELGADPTEPFHSEGYPQLPAALSPISRMIGDTARQLGLHPSRLPLAFNHRRHDGRAPCAACGTCDLFACAIEAKNDLATVVLPRLLQRGLRLETDTVAVRLITEGRRITGVDCVPRLGGAPVRYTGRLFILSAGALASPHLVLASGLEKLSSGAEVIGRNLMRHYNAVVMGAFPRRPDRELQFHKQLAIHDYYFGDPATPYRKLGAIQQLSTPPGELVKAFLPPVLGSVVATAALPHSTGLLVMAEDQPRPENRVVIDPRRTDRFGLPELQITHRYSPRDQAAGRVLVGHAKRILRAAGAWFTYVQPVRTFSHAVGTLRMGTDPRTSALDADCLFRGSENLYVVDASCFPTAAAVNPSLTIAANALRVGERLAATRRGRGASAA